MSAPPPRGLPGTPAYIPPGSTARAPLPEADVAALFASAIRARSRQQGRPLPQPQARQRRQQPRASSRPGDPRGLLLTRQQWADYDEWTALQDRQMAKYGHFAGYQQMANVARGIWLWPGRPSRSRG